MNKDEAEAKAAEPVPDATAATPKAEATAAKPMAEAKVAEPKPDATAAKPMPEAKVAPPKADATAATHKADVRNKIIFGLSILGVLAALVAAYLFGIERKAQPPAFAPVSSPYESAIYANGIVESDQSSGSNVNIYPE